jgi:hypothetical protein
LTAGAPQSRPESDAAAHFGRNAEEKRGKNTFCAAFLFPLLYCSPGISQETKHFFRGSTEFPHVYTACTEKESCNLHRTGIKTQRGVSCAFEKRVGRPPTESKNTPRVVKFASEREKFAFLHSGSVVLAKRSELEAGGFAGAERSFELAYLPI